MIKQELTLSIANTIFAFPACTATVLMVVVEGWASEYSEISDEVSWSIFAVFNQILIKNSFSTYAIRTLSNETK